MSMGDFFLVVWLDIKKLLLVKIWVNLFISHLGLKVKQTKSAVIPKYNKLFIWRLIISYPGVKERTRNFMLGQHPTLNLRSYFFRENIRHFFSMIIFPFFRLRGRNWLRQSLHSLLTIVTQFTSFLYQLILSMSPTIGDILSDKNAS